MSWLEALILGIIQGISEFLPISSSAHLILAEHLLGISFGGNPLAFEVFLHLASLLAVLFYFRKDLLALVTDFFTYSRTKSPAAKANYRFVWLLGLATVVTMISGKAVESYIGESILNPATIGVALIVTGLFLVLIEHGVKLGHRTEKEMSWKDGVIIGLGQALAVIPGISRAGSTLITALWCGLSKETAVRYSFLLSIPVISGITIIKLPDILNLHFSTMAFELSIAFLASFVFALVGIKWLIQMVNKAKLSYFAIYCIGLGLFTWMFV
ncbi:undecaprenyl-diphosphatase UppP [Bacillus alkalicellulosilyticus]|uniref:undecaprenyl-diphosphatase UppP n=1 Tax=Alkalihalobacterium alkalicellulosilyticum TaxID=1912214 RepID=UPI000998BDCE|nr:undecaprenyl-diphosphatase UppP [Bacillus alkalicellulosilyticus]